MRGQPPPTGDSGRAAADLVHNVRMTRLGVGTMPLEATLSVRTERIGIPKAVSGSIPPVKSVASDPKLGRRCGVYECTRKSVRRIKHAGRHRGENKVAGLQFALHDFAVDDAGLYFSNQAGFTFVSHTGTTRDFGLGQTPDRMAVDLHGIYSSDTHSGGAIRVIRRY